MRRATRAAVELVTNAQTYGCGPVVLHGWRRAADLVLTVWDHGAGPPDPLAGLVPGRAVGLSTVHLVADDVALTRGMRFGAHARFARA